MKIQLFAVIFSFCLFISCKSDNGNKELNVLTQRIQYEVAIKSPDISFDWWVQNIDGAKRESFVKSLIQAAYGGKIDVYDDFGEKLTTEQVKGIENSIDSVYVSSDTPPYNDSLIVNVNRLQIHSITRFSFLEEWKYNNSSFEIKKRILGFAPLIEKFDREGELMGYKPLFWLYFDKNYPNELKGI